VLDGGRLSGLVSRRGLARLLTACAVLVGLFLMHGAPATAAEGCHGAMPAPASAHTMADAAPARWLRPPPRARHPGVASARDAVASRPPRGTGFRCRRPGCPPLSPSWRWRPAGCRAGRWVGRGEAAGPPGAGRVCCSRCASRGRDRTTPEPAVNGIRPSVLLTPARHPAWRAHPERSPLMFASSRSTGAAAPSRRPVPAAALALALAACGSSGSSNDASMPGMDHSSMPSAYSSPPLPRRRPPR